MPDELWNEVHDIVQETGIKTIPREKKGKKVKWLSGEALHTLKPAILGRWSTELKTEQMKPCHCSNRGRKRQSGSGNWLLTHLPLA